MSTKLVQPLQAILIPSDRNWRALLEGSRTSAIQPGHVAFHNGEAMIAYLQDSEFVQARITHSKHYKAANVPASDMRASGYFSREDMIEDLRSTRPDFGLNSSLTVVRWKNVSGSPAIDYQTYASNYLG